MIFDRKNLSDQQLIELYSLLLKPRLIEEKMLLLLRQGRISKWFSGIGQEAIAVGAAYALQSDEYILPLHRNLGVFTTREIPLNRLFAQFQGKRSGFTGGRDRSFHFGTRDHYIIGMISHLGPQLGVADGIALAHQLRDEKKAVLVFSGDGGASEGDFHEALNVASVWNLPVIFLVENNGYGLSTPSLEQFRHQHFVDKGPGYGMEAYQFDGNNILEAYHTISMVASGIRKDPHPVLLEAITFRMRGHEEASGIKYVPRELLDHWSKKDPVQNYEQYLMELDLLDQEKLYRIKSEIKRSIDEGLSVAFAESDPEFSLEEEVGDIYFPHGTDPAEPAKGNEPAMGKMTDRRFTRRRFVDAVNNALLLAFEKYPDLIIMGQDIAEYGGVFKATEGMVEKFGRKRVRNTPLCESAILGAGLGLSIEGIKSIIEMQFADFVTCGFNQIVNNLAKVHYRWGQYADVVVRMPTGAGVGAGPFHSQSNEAWFFHTPGLKIAYPSNPYDAKGLLLASIEDPNPVMFFEHKGLYRAVHEEIPDDYYTLPLGKARKIREGTDLTIITYGMGVIWAEKILGEIPDISAELIDLRSLLPWDREMVADSVKKTGKVIILHEDTLTGGIGAEIAAFISESLFEYLDGPVMREGSLDTPVPFARNLEEHFLPPERFRKKLLQLLEF
ncbi:MAG: dehydrogenase E1 component subunit alpha/beta [Cyclobacteriaceae bacterium]|nr:dehydrogenase E1 component subunit alpha/beta [Cyclobacteriaceae bacterium]